MGKVETEKETTGKQCGRCKRHFASLSSLDKSTKEKLAQKGHSEFSEGQYCKSCLAYIMNEAFSTVLEKRVKIEQDKRKAELWQSRLKYLKQGKNSFQSKNMVDAVKNYSSYLMVLEKVLDIGNGELAPEFFRTMRGEKEKSVVALVYFDLMRIYDKNDTTYDNFIKCLEKVRLFAVSIKEGKGILKSIDHYLNYSNEAVHKKELKKLLAEMNKKIKIKKKCFVATYIYRDEDCIQLVTLRYFRDNYMFRSKIATSLVELYYNHAPKLIPVLDRVRILKLLTKVLLDNFVFMIELFCKRRPSRHV